MAVNDPESTFAVTEPLRPRARTGRHPPVVAEGIWPEPMRYGSDAQTLTDAAVTTSPRSPAGRFVTAETNATLLNTWDKSQNKVAP